jgi:hypothetical protein
MYTGGIQKYVLTVFLGEDTRNGGTGGLGFAGNGSDLFPEKGIQQGAFSYVRSSDQGNKSRFLC